MTDDQDSTIHGRFGAESAHPQRQLHKKSAETAHRLKVMAENLDQWAEITALAMELRRSVLALKTGKETAEILVWREMREMKEKTWMTGPS